MSKKKRIFSGGLICLFLLLTLFSGQAPAQEKSEDPIKLFNEIAGDFEFEYEGEYMIFIFTVEDGKLMCAPEGETPEVMEPLAGQEMTFFAFDPDGTEYNFKFTRNEEGDLSKCTVTVPAMGIEVTGTRIRI